MDVSVLPTEKAVRRVAKRLNKSSCAVLGASSALNNCADICSSHDVNLKVNFHPLVDRLCPRTDIRVVNGGTLRKRTKIGAVDAFPPTLFTFGTMWNPGSVSTDARNAWLSTGFAFRHVDEMLGEVGESCCHTSGGVALALALHACRRVSVYGIGGVGAGYIGDPLRKAPGGYHNLRGERKWIDALAREGRVNASCL